MNEDTAVGLGCLIYVFVVLVNLAFFGFLGWAIYELVTHFTG